jgi:hypothetical protein
LRLHLDPAGYGAKKIAVAVWSNPARKQLVTAARWWAPAPQPSIVWADKRGPLMGEHGGDPPVFRQRR